jgi:hypothetical protein
MADLRVAGTRGALRRSIWYQCGRYLAGLGDAPTVLCDPPDAIPSRHAQCIYASIRASIIFLQALSPFGCCNHIR